MNIALFGGTFDPIHSGHLRAARVASRKFQLDQVLFIPSGRPPHKISGHLTDFAHRYAMVVLACANEPRFIPSLLESPTVDNRTRYSIQTARAVQRTLHAGDHLFFLIGVDALLDLRHWREYRALLGLVNFIVATRPGSDARKIWEVLPQDMTSADNRQRQRPGCLSRCSPGGRFRTSDYWPCSAECGKIHCEGRAVQARKQKTISTGERWSAGSVIATPEKVTGR